MSPNPLDYRLDVPDMEVPDDLVHRLADLARSSTPTRPTRRPWVVAVAAAAVGAALLATGGAWASGALTVPGLPAPHSGPSAPPAPTRATAPGSEPTPTATHPSLTGGPGSVTPSSASSRPPSGSKSDHPAHPAHPVHPVHPVHPAHPSHATHPTHPAHPSHPAHPAAQQGKSSAKAQPGANASKDPHG